MSGGWELRRQVTLGVLLALFIQTGGALVWFGQVSERLDQLEAVTERQVSLSERLARLEEQTQLVRESLVRIERRMGD
jgi:Tfp pilus assembly protein PilO